MRRALVALLGVAVVALAGCGTTTVVRERDLEVRGSIDPTRVPRDPAPESGHDVRIAVVTHGQASSAFWAIVRNGIDAAARQVKVSVTYRSPDSFSVRAMRRLIDEAAAAHPDGLVVSLPSPALSGAIKRAERAGIPVVTINSGYDLFRRLGAVAHVGQPEGRAGYEAGRRLVAAGVHHAVCLNLEAGNEALDRRCDGFARALRQAGATSRTLRVNFDDQSASVQLLSDVIAARRIDGALALSSSGAEAMLEALRVRHRLHGFRLGTFDMSPGVLEAVRSGQILFAIDQQPYLQGYLPIVLLAERHRHGLFPAEGELVPTGPHFVTRATAGQAESLSARGIR